MLMKSVLWGHSQVKKKKKKEYKILAETCMKNWAKGYIFQGKSLQVTWSIRLVIVQNLL